MILNSSEFDVNTILKYPLLKQGRGRRKKNYKEYIDCVCAFDIEATSLPDIEQSFMYIWQFQLDNEATIIGRTWEEFMYFIQKISDVIEGTLVIYVHNLSYEFQFLSGIYDFKQDEVFATEPRKILRCSMFDNIEFRCSYFLTNTSLEVFTKQMKVENIKLSGAEFDYSKIRYPWTELTDDELAYCINDVKGLVQALKKQMKADNDDLRTIPLTSTGYVRRDIRYAMMEYNHDQLLEMLPDVKIYSLLRQAFRGGDTHANRWVSDLIINNVSSVDRVSSYPDVMLNCDFPMSKFWKIEVKNFKEFWNFLRKHRLAGLFRISFHNIELKDMMDGAPYLARDKCRNIVNGVFDNGRVISADYLETTITDVDMKIILMHYRFEGCNPYECYYAKYRKLPKMFTDVILKYYKIKTELKGCDEESEDYIIYMLSKARLNACYGMSAQDPVKDSIDYIDGEFVMRDEPVEDLLAKHNYNAFSSYAWGVWTTAWARYRLHEVIVKTGTNFVYCDTDSVKYTGELDISDYNNVRIKDSLESGSYAVDNKGEVHYMGVFESEGYELPNRFATQGAKKYVLEDKNKNLHITIAGVNKKIGAKELGKIENFKEGYTFYKAGGTESVYNDDVNMYIKVDGRDLHITKNIFIKPSTYTLGLTEEYKRILSGRFNIAYFDIDMGKFYRLKKGLQ